MNKKLFVLICSLILFQYINNACTTKTDLETNEVSCDGTPTDGNTKVCELKNNECVERTLSCTEKKTGATDEICGKLSVGNGKVCKKDTAKDSTKCIEEDKPSSKSNGANNLKYSLVLLIFLFLF